MHEQCTIVQFKLAKYGREFFLLALFWPLNYSLSSFSLLIQNIMLFFCLFFFFFFFWIERASFFTAKILSRPSPINVVWVSELSSANPGSMLLVWKTYLEQKGKIFCFYFYSLDLRMAIVVIVDLGIGEALFQSWTDRCDLTKFAALEIK